MSLELIFLGTGTSAGVPMIGCDCAVCTSADPRDHRSRPSVLVRYRDARSQTRQLLIDTAPELRQQAIREKITHVDGVLYTHAHADHILGIDDLRRFNAVMDAPVNIYGERRVLDALHEMFAYIFQSHRNINPSFVAQLIPNEIVVDRPHDLFGVRWTAIRLLHGRLPIVGYRIDHPNGSLAYCTDVSSFPPEAYVALANLDVLVVDALRYRHHPTHMTVDQALDAVDQLNPKRAYFTHIAHDVQHADLENKLPSHVQLAYDGLRVEV